MVPLPPQNKLELGVLRSTFPLFNQILTDVNTNTAIPTIGEAWQFIADLSGGPMDQLAAGSADTYGGHWKNFAQYCAAHDVEHLDEVTEELVRRFVAAPARGGTRPAVSTQRGRLAAVRYLFRAIHPFAGIDDPSGMIRLDPRNQHRIRPLTDAELERCHHIVDHVVMTDRFLVIVALAEAGATTGEIGFVQAADLRGDEVSLPGDKKVVPRSIELTPWGRDAVRRWAKAVEPEADDLVAVRATGYDSRRTSVTHVLREVLRRAGLGDQQDLEPKSFLAAAARRVFDDTGRIEAAARTIGAHSLDRTAELIGFDWAAE